MRQRAESWARVAFGLVVLLAGLGLADLGAAPAAADEERRAKARSESDPSAGRTPAARTPSSASRGGSRHAVPRSSGGVESRTRHSPQSYSSRGHYHGRRGSFSFGFGYPFWWTYYGRHHGYPYYGSVYYGYHPWGWVWYPAPPAPTVDSLGAFDLNVKPKKAEVYLDGQYVGTAGKFDGFPGHLWVRRGEHELIFYRPGYRTVVRKLHAAPGVVIDVRLRMEEGESAPPEEFLSRQASRRPLIAETPPPAAAPARPAEPAPAPAPGSAAGLAAGTLDLRTEPARFRLRVEPGDASVYLDGRLLGSGAELARLHSGLVVDAGEHRLEVVRPGYDSQSLELRAEAGEEREVSIRLEPTPSG